MDRNANERILARLERALEEGGAEDAVRRLGLLAPALRAGDDERLRSLVLRHCREYGLDAAAILNGDDASPASPQQAFPSAFDLTPVFAMGSVDPRNGSWRLREIERIALAPALLSPARFVTRMESRALEPRIRLGAYLVIDTAEVGLPEDDATPSAFAVALRDEGLLVRLAQRDKEGNRLLLKGLAADVPSIAVPCGSPDYRVVGRVVWVAQPL